MRLFLISVTIGVIGFASAEGLIPIAIDEEASRRLQELVFR